jgi:hypothetical protein
MMLSGAAMAFRPGEIIAASRAAAIRQTGVAAALPQ